jgi:L-amino acid N-acyltransferase YncA
MKVIEARKKDIEQIIEIDKEIIGTDRRKKEIGQAIEQNRCLLVIHEGIIAGFLLYHTHFFECTFVSLIMIKPSHQKMGLASTLLSHMTEFSKTEKLFSSTNQSNLAMQKIFEANAFIKSGMVENLDEGDPELIYFKRIGERNKWYT